MRKIFTSILVWSFSVLDLWMLCIVGILILIMPAWLFERISGVSGGFAVYIISFIILIGFVMPVAAIVLDKRERRDLEARDEAQRADNTKVRGTK